MTDSYTAQKRARSSSSDNEAGRPELKHSRPLEDPVVTLLKTWGAELERVSTELHQLSIELSSQELSKKATELSKMGKDMDKMVKSFDSSKGDVNDEEELDDEDKIESWAEDKLAMEAVDDKDVQRPSPEL